MADRRETPFSGRVAHASLRGAVAAESFTEGWRQQVREDAFLCAAPAGARDRELLFGDLVTTIEARGAWSFVRSDKDGYCGWLPEAALGPVLETTHRVAVRASHAYDCPEMKTPPIRALSFGATVRVVGGEDRWAEIAWPKGSLRESAWVPAAHLDAGLAEDPAEVAAVFLGTPYVWAGNSGAGIDCSGLVQAALLACGIPCPGDSDLQAARVGRALGAGEPLRRGDLLFWKGHVAMAVDPATLIHANAYAMAVAYEGTEETIARIEAQGGGPVTARRRPRD